ncbi:MAG: T9SS type A sorting domain-containing protein [Bacteroidota bacterium]
MKRSLLLLLLCTVSLFASATTFRAAATGNWNTTSTWMPSGVPSSRDTVIINGLFTVTVTSAATCGEFTITGANSVLTINSGASLTVANNATMLVDDLVDISIINVLGSLNVGGNVIMTYTDALAALSSNLMNVGSSTAPGTLTVGGNIQFTAQTILSLLGVRSTIRLFQGTVNVAGDIAFNASGAGAGVQSFTVDDDNANDGKTKVINLSKNIINPTSGQVTLNDANNNAPYNFRYIGTTQQNFVTSNVAYRNVEISNTNSEVWLTTDVPNASVTGTLTIRNGAVLNTKTFDLDNMVRFAGQITIDNGGVLRVENSGGVPAQKVGGSYVCNASSQAVIDYNAIASSTILDVFSENFNYPIVRFSGPGTKQMASFDLDNISMTAHQIQHNEGTWSIARGKKLVLSTVLDRTVNIGSGTNVIINGDFTTLTAFWSINYNSTFQYNETGAQKVYSLRNKTGAVEPYGSLTLQRLTGTTATNRDVAAADLITVRGKLQLGGNIRLNINANATVELASDAVYTGYLAEVPTSAAINYLGAPAGRFVAKKFIALTDANYRDFSSPLTSKTLATWQNAGMYLTGFAGSLYPQIPFVSAYQYDETNTGGLNDGFLEATNITNPLTTNNSAGKTIRSGWRIYTGESAGQSYTLADSGVVRTGTVTHTLSFTHGAKSRTTDDGWNFLGNPYPSAVSWSSIYNDAENAGSIGANGIKPTIYIWRPTDTGSPYDEEDSYGFYNAVTGVSSNLSSTIPSFQGFWLKTYHATSNSTAYDLKIKEAHKVNLGASTFYKAEEGEVNKSLVKVTLQQGELTDNIWFHTFSGATTGIDEMYDVERFGEVYDGPNLNFSTANESLNLWVNAIPSKGKEVSFPVQVYIPEEGEFTIALNNVEGFIKSYGCIRLVDQKTNTTYPITSDTVLVFTGAAGSREERFMIIAAKNLLSTITTADATCFDKEDGLLAVDLSDYTDVTNFTLYKDSTVYNTYFGNVTEIYEELGRGNYSLVNNSGLLDCVSDRLNFEVNSFPEVTAAFESPTEWPEDTYVPLHNSSEGATNYYWEFSDFQATSPNKTPNYRFEEPGNFTISLVAINQFSCESERVERGISILSATGIQDISKSGFSLRDNESGFGINTASFGAYRVSVFSTDGKLVFQSGELSGNQQVLLTKTGAIYLVKIDSKDGVYTTRILH